MKDESDTMKWWGWGDEEIQFDMDSRPRLWPFIKHSLKIANEPTSAPPIPFEAIELPEPCINESFLEVVQTRLGGQQVRTAKKDRLTHAFGKSLRDLWRVRHGLIPYAPDCVLYPQSYDEVRTIVEAAVAHNVRLIPFGGGSNIVGCLEPSGDDPRMAVSVDMRAMYRLLDLDRDSGCARFEAGALGPQVESQINPLGFTLGHFPDSFLFSTVGGWVASRSAGMQSDFYGKIEDMVVSLRMVTPAGTIETRAVPRASNGIDVNHFCIGSEGTLGIITDVSLRVHPVPERARTYGYLFPDFSSGLEAMHECVRLGGAPVMMRLNDANKTALSIAYRQTEPAWKGVLSQMMKAYLSGLRGVNLSRVCLLLAKFEGARRKLREDRRRTEATYRRFGAIGLGAEPGRTFEAGKYDFPYLRDYCLDRGILADVSETATVWSNLLRLYEATEDSIRKAFVQTGCSGWLGTHISHSYYTGASLYFTFAFVGTPGREMDQYLQIKKAAEDTFLNHGATLSHHHAVGYEHLPWLERDVSPTGVKAIQSLKKGLDPRRIMNPGRLEAGFGFDDWGLQELERNPGPKHGECLTDS